jgi:aspartyl-tRNA(Asn)/glutamyl-tRNA(Gln) amidotransferase subunit C
MTQSASDTSVKPESETSVQTVERLAGLARIAIPDAQKEALAAEFAQVLAYIAQLDELKLDTQGAPVVPPVHNVFRADEKPYETGEWTERIVAAFPSKSGNALTVKKIISHD